MNMPENLLAVGDSAPVTVHNEAGRSPFLIVADHAGNLTRPARHSERECERHSGTSVSPGSAV